MVVDDDDYDDDVWDDATEGWKGLKGWGSNGKWCMIHKIDYILTIVTDWLTKQNPEMLSHLKIETFLLHPLDTSCFIGWPILG